MIISNKRQNSVFNFLVRPPNAINSVFSPQSNKNPNLAGRSKSILYWLLPAIVSSANKYWCNHFLPRRRISSELALYSELIVGGALSPSESIKHSQIGFIQPAQRKDWMCRAVHSLLNVSFHESLLWLATFSLIARGGKEKRPASILNQ